MSSNLDPNSDLERPRSQIDDGPSSSGVSDKKKNKKEVNWPLFPTPDAILRSYPFHLTVLVIYHGVLP